MNSQGRIQGTATGKVDRRSQARRRQARCPSWEHHPCKLKGRLSLVAWWAEVLVTSCRSPNGAKQLETQHDESQDNTDDHHPRQLASGERDAYFSKLESGKNYTK